MSTELPLVPQFIASYIQNFADKRLPETSQQVEVNRHRLYILPTRHGVVFFGVLLLILFGAINYENSLGFMLAFLLGSLGFLAMIYTHQNINHLIVSIGRAESVFAGQTILFPLTIKQSVTDTHPALQLSFEKGQTVHTHLIKVDSVNCNLPMTAGHRGYLKPGRIKLFSEYPLGLFHAWSWLNLDSQCLVYPAPDPHHYPLLLAGDIAPGQTTDDKQGVDDFAGIRQYQTGDLPNHLAWKAIAKTNELQTKVFNNETSQDIIISWAQTSEMLDIEQRLSILCRMVLDATEQSRNFGLKIPGTVIHPASGLQHKHRCLKALALYGTGK